MSQSKVESPSKEQIERRPYELYLESGCIDGRDMENWLAAEQELRKDNENRDLAPNKNVTATAQRRKARSRLSKSAAN